MTHSSPDSSTLSPPEQVFAGRVSADLPDGTVIFLIGMRINRPLLVHRWLPPFMAMPRMIRELTAQPERGFLGARTWLSGRNVMVQQYWRSMDDLMAYAHAREAEHLPAWRAFNRRIGTDGTVGIWHEAHAVRADESHVVYRNMPAFGLGAAVGRTAARPASPPKHKRPAPVAEPAPVTAGR